MLVEYQKAPQVTRDRMYIDAMQQIYGNVTKILVDSKQGSNLLYLPLDKIMQMTTQNIEEPLQAQGSSANSAASGGASGVISDSRTRDASRARSRDSR